jgi:hypothetical protein
MGMKGYYSIVRLGKGNYFAIKQIGENRNAVDKFIKSCGHKIIKTFSRDAMIRFQNEGRSKYLVRYLHHHDAVWDAIIETKI